MKVVHPTRILKRHLYNPLRCLLDVRVI